MELNRPSAVAGSYYKQDEHELFAQMDGFIYPVKTTPLGNIKALILPHSGFQYVGKVIGQGYAHVNGKKVDEVFLLGPSHYSKFEYVAFGDYQTWEVPVGKIESSHRVKQIVASDDESRKDLFRFDDSVHEREHSLEVQLPWIRTIWGEQVRIVPMLVGEVSPRLVANALAETMDKDDLIIASAELSHGYPRDYAEVIDATAITAIEKLDVETIMSEKFKSTAPVVIATIAELAKKNNWTPTLLKYENINPHDDISNTNGVFAMAFSE